MPEPDLLQIERGVVVAPAGCGKTELISRALARHTGSLPILVLTHTNAGVAALRARLDRAGVSTGKYRLATIDGWAIRLISTFPVRSGHDPAILFGPRPDYLAIRVAATSLLLAGHINEIISASYARLFVDEYQDCSCRQHAFVAGLTALLPTAVVGDPLQAIFGFNRADCLPSWDEEVCSFFSVEATLDTPWRWNNAGTEPLGLWLLEVRKALLARGTVDLNSAPEQVCRVVLAGANGDYQRQLKAGGAQAPGGNGTILVLADSKSPQEQRRFASCIPGAVTVEAADLGDLCRFAAEFDFQATTAVAGALKFAATLMTHFRADDMLQRLATLAAGRARKPASSAEEAALAFESDRTYSRLAALLDEIHRQPYVRLFRPAVFRACTKALNHCIHDRASFADAAIKVREENRFLGRSLPHRAVGSTLLLKGLEADVAVILNADNMDARHLYVAMTRASRRLVICSRSRFVGNAAAPARPGAQLG